MARPAPEPHRGGDRRDHARGHRALVRAVGPATPALVPPFTPDLEAFRLEVRAWVDEALRPRVDQWEADHWFPGDVFADCAERGYLGLKYPASVGGSDRGYLPDAVFTEELARCGSGGVASGIGAHIGIATPPVWKFGTPDQHERYLAPAVRGEKIAALAITEPDAGSDVAAIRTRAERVDGGWVVNGAKTYITGGVRADYLVTAVKTSAEGGHHGISFLIVDKGPGVSTSALEKLGWHASDTAEIAFEDVYVPEENLLGQENGGFYLIMANFQWERLLMSLGAVGAMEAAFGPTRAFAEERALGQAARHRLAGVATRLATCRALTYQALRLFVEERNPIQEVTMAKLATQRAAFEVMEDCLAIHALAGVDAPGLERGLRDARLGPIGGGTDEVMKEILGKTL